MTAFLRSWLVIVLGTLAVCAWTADRPAGHADAEQPSLATNDDDGPEAELGPILPIGSLVAMDWTTSDGAHWKTTDALLDEEVGRLVMLLAEPAGAAKHDSDTNQGAKNDLKDSARWVPWRRVRTAFAQRAGTDGAAGKPLVIAMSDADLKNCPSARPDGGWTRAWAAKVIEKTRPAGSEAASGRKYDPAKELIPWSKLRDTEVINADRQVLGKIVGLAILVPGGRIAYAAISSRDLPDDQLRPLPLSAFVAPANQSRWVLELPEAIVKKTATFARGAWPKTLDQGWIEYVHVRYGRSPTRGRAA